MTEPKLIKIRWIGPDRRIPDLGITVAAGDEVEISESQIFGGEGTDWQLVDPPKPKTTKPKTAGATNPDPEE